MRADSAAGETSLRAVERRDNPVAGAGDRSALALGFTAAVTAFVGAIVVLTIPYAVLSVSLPPSVNRLGLAVETTQVLFFGRPWYLLVPAMLVAVWVGYRSYRWYRTTTTTSDQDATELADG
ncbi:MAG: hypothetical protein ACE5LU_04200 [Anaerolineae bacterium]